MHLTLNRRQPRRRLSMSLAVRRAQTMASAASSGVAVSRLVSLRVLLRARGTAIVFNGQVEVVSDFRESPYMYV